jgi:hypothetical protein
LTGTPLQINKFKWNAIVNFTRNRNLVKSLPVDEIRLGGYGNLAPTLREGEPYGVFYGTAFKRNEAGQLLLNDAGYPQINPPTPNNPTGEKRIGNPQPDWLMGIRNTFTYSGLSLSFLWDIRKGGDVANVTGNWMNAQGIPKNSEDRGHLVVFKGIRESDSQVNTTPALLNQALYYGVNAGNRNIAERMIEDGSWFRLRDVTLTYSFPKFLISKIKLTNLDLSVYGRNLILITNYTGIDPETNLYGPVSSPNSPNSAIGIDAFGTPNTKSYGISLNVTL